MNSKDPQLVHYFQDTVHKAVDDQYRKHPLKTCKVRSAAAKSQAVRHVDKHQILSLNVTGNSNDGKQRSDTVTQVTCMSVIKGEP